MRLRQSSALLAVALVGVTLTLGIEALARGSADGGGGAAMAGWVLDVVGPLAGTALVFGYAYHLGRTGAAGSRAAVVSTALAAGVLGGLVATAVRATVFSPELFGDLGGPALVGATVTWVVDFVVLYGLAGVAGVPLGERGIGWPSRAPSLDSAVLARVGAATAAVVVVATVLRWPYMIVPDLRRGKLWFGGFEWRLFRTALADLLLYGVPLGLAYGLGRRGWTASASSVAGTFALVGVVASTVQWGVWALAVFTPNVAFLVFNGVGFGVRFALVGLAGVPLGRLAVADGAPPGTDTDDTVLDG